MILRRLTNRTGSPWRWKLGLSYGIEEQLVRGEAVFAEIEKARE